MIFREGDFGGVWGCFSAVRPIWQSALFAGPVFPAKFGINPTQISARARQLVSKAEAKGNLTRFNVQSATLGAAGDCLSLLSLLVLPLRGVLIANVVDSSFASFAAVDGTPRFARA